VAQRLALGDRQRRALALEAPAHEIGVDRGAAARERDHRIERFERTARDRTDQAAGALEGDLAGVELLAQHREGTVVTGVQAVGLHRKIGPAQLHQLALGLPQAEHELVAAARRARGVESEQVALVTLALACRRLLALGTAATPAPPATLEEE